MYSKLVALCALVAVSQAGLLPAGPTHYSSAEAVSSQSYVRHEQPQTYTTKLVAAAPVAKYTFASPVAYHSAPAHYSSSESVSSQNIVRHEQPSKLISTPVYHAAPAPVTYHAAPAPVTYHSAPTQISYHSAPTQVSYHAAPVTKVLAQPEENSYPKYEYTYSVADGHTGDNKSLQETRDGDVVKGSYSFHEADGSIRTVEYTADDHNGFNAVVHNTAPTAAPVVVKTAPVLLKAPTVQYYKH